jgi:hypothetical protein
MIEYCVGGETDQVSEVYKIAVQRKTVVGDTCDFKLDLYTDSPENSIYQCNEEKHISNSRYPQHDCQEDRRYETLNQAITGPVNLLALFILQWNPGNTTNHGTDVGWPCYQGGRISEIENCIP